MIFNDDWNHALLGKPRTHRIRRKIAYLLRLLAWKIDRPWEVIPSEHPEHRT